MSVLTFTQFYANMLLIAQQKKNKKMTLELSRETKPPTPVEATFEPIDAEVGHEKDSLFSDEEVRAFASNVFNIYEKTMTNNERLSALAQVNLDQFKEEVDTLTQEFLDEDADFQNFKAEFKKALHNGAGDTFVPEMNARYAKARELVISSLNLPEKIPIDEIEDSKKHIQELLIGIPKERQYANLALSTLGAKVEVEGTPGEYVYSYPYDLFPDKVNDKWADYLESVQTHIEAAENTTLETRNNVDMADRARKYAHDGITKTIHSLLQLDQFGVTEKETREVLAKMRNDELMLAREPHKSVHKKTPEEVAVSKHLARRRYDH